MPECPGSAAVLGRPTCSTRGAHPLWKRGGENGAARAGGLPHEDGGAPRNAPSLARDLPQQLRVGWEALHEVDEALDGVDRFSPAEAAADDADLVQVIGRDE